MANPKKLTFGGKRLTPEILERYKKVSKEYDIPLNIVASTGATESFHGYDKRVEKGGNTQGLFHITRGAGVEVARKMLKNNELANKLSSMSKDEYREHLLKNRELEDRLAGGYLKMSYDEAEGDPVKTYGVYNSGVGRNLKKRPLNKQHMQNMKNFQQRYEDSFNFIKAEEPMAKEKKKKEEQPSLLGPLRQEEPKVADKEIAMVMQDVIPKDDPVAAQTMRNNLLVEGDQEETTSGAPVSPGKVLQEKIGTNLQEKKEENERKPASIESRQEEENKKFQLSQSMKDALSYFGPRMGALLLGGVNAMEITDNIMTGFESQQRGRTQDRQKAQQLQQQDQITPFQQEQLDLRREALDLRKEQASASDRAAEESVNLTEKQQDTLDKIDGTLGSMQTARQFLKKGNLTGFFDNYIRGAADTARGNPRAYGRKVLEKLRVDDALIRIGQTKGAISDKEMGLFLSPAPTLNDQEDVWLKWIDERESAAKKIRDRIKTGKRAENPATDSQVNSFTGSSSQEEDDALINKYY
tara:strand:- start:705 stop:2282 length:1578 start_codon:yes stop_codon:yes gene_type:complete